MSAPSVGGSAVPSSLASGGTYGGGRYVFQKQQPREAASGTAYYVGYQNVEWTWPRMGTTEWAWWQTQWARGSAMPFELWADDTRNTAISFTSGYLQRPDHTGIEAGLYCDAKIVITKLMPIQS